MCFEQFSRRGIFQYTDEEILANIQSSCKAGQHRYTLKNEKSVSNFNLVHGFWEPSIQKPKITPRNFKEKL